MPFIPGENVGPYRILEQLGQGGMASVFKAYHPALDRFVAIKALHPAFGGEAGFVARFQREARMVARLDHPHIVPIFDFAQHEGRPYLVMRYIEGRTLKARLMQGPLVPAEIVRVAEAVGAALDFAHGQGILHRDVKPSNVLLATAGQIYLADFGLARMAQAADSTLSSDMIMGTPQYISPEQARGEKNLSPATDIYSFGVLLFEMVVGQVPFNADTPFSIIHDHIYSPLPMPRAINPGVPEEVQRVLLKSLAKEPADRYLDVASLVAAFKAAWPGDEHLAPAATPAASLTPSSERATLVEAAPVPPPAAAAPKPPVAARRKSKRTRWLWGGSAAAVLCLLFTCFLAVVANRNPQTGSLTGAETANQPGIDLAGSPALATAQAQARLKPDDPNALLQVSLAHWDASNPRAAMLELQKAARLAGPTNAAFFKTAGDEYWARAAWLPAAVSYRLAIKSAVASGAAPEQLIERYHESVYKAASMPGFLEALPKDALLEVEPSMGTIAEARHRFHSGEEALARRLLTEVLEREPGFREAMLLDAEIKLAQGEAAIARNILGKLVDDSGTPAWIRQFAADLAGRSQ